MFKILVSDPISDVGLKTLIEADDIKLDIKTDLTPEGLLAIIGEYDGLLVRSQTTVSRDVIAAAKNLKVIGRAGVGVDNIDTKAATELGVVVINAPDGNTISTAEHSFAMIASMARWIPQADHDLKSGKWNRKKYTGVELNNKVLGVIGLGRIGSEVIKRAKAFNMDVIGYDPFVTEERANQLGIKTGSVEDVVKAADFLTIHTPLTKETKYIIDDKEFALMKKGIRIVNCARGGVIREEALLKAIESGIVAGAALDVYEEEPPAADNALVNHPQVITTPHLGASTVEAQLNVAIDVAAEVYNFLKGVPFKNAINLPSIPADILVHVQPYLELAEKLGKLITNTLTAAIEKIEIIYAGDIVDKEVDILTRTVLKGILSEHIGSAGMVNDVNAPTLAKERGIEYVDSRSSKSKGYTNLIAVKIKTTKEDKAVSGTILDGYGPRIVNVDGFTVDFKLTGNLLLMEHTDQPGIIGDLGKVLGNAGLNIATMQVGRNEVGGKAVAFLMIDNLADDQVLGEIKKINGVTNIYQVEL